MSALLALVLLATSIQIASDPPPKDDVVVLARRLKQMRLLVKKNGKTGEQRCIVKRSSGSKDFDTAMCTASLTCTSAAGAAVQFRLCMAPHVEAYTKPLGLQWQATTPKDIP